MWSFGVFNKCRPGTDPGYGGSKKVLSYINNWVWKTLQMMTTSHMSVTRARFNYSKDNHTVSLNINYNFIKNIGYNYYSVDCIEN